MANLTPTHTHTRADIYLLCVAHTPNIFRKFPFTLYQVATSFCFLFQVQTKFIFHLVFYKAQTAKQQNNKEKFTKLVHKSKKNKIEKEKEKQLRAKPNKVQSS